ncbi:MAG: encapsulin [Trebonia sp.]
MAVNLGRDNLPWSADTWRDIDAAVLDAAGPLRTAQKVFPAATDGNGQYVPDDAIQRQEGATALEIPEGRTKPYVELSVDVALTQAQVENEDTLHTGRTLTVLAAKEVAQAEDTLFFQGAAALAHGLLRVANGAGAGLLNLDGAPVVDVPGEDGGYGLNTFKSVVDGIGVLTGNGQPGPYALVLATDVFADAYAPVGGTLTTTADRLTPLLPGGFYGTGTLPARTGLLASLGGQPTMLYVGQDLITAYAQSNDKGQTVLRVYERVQIIARDPTAIVKLAFR